ncbi:hypothetical protein, partial [Bradyrhizobium zhanjiangense]|uniref:hypothetical protein n=1 Tax=Bradyrhizobium zhanjiangense TaxID=1325107 RepID=UPI0019D6B90F
QPHPAPFRDRIYRPDRDGAKSRLNPSTFSGEDQSVTSTLLRREGASESLQARADFVISAIAAELPESARIDSPPFSTSAR